MVAKKNLDQLKLDSKAYSKKLKINTTRFNDAIEAFLQAYPAYKYNEYLIDVGTEISPETPTSTINTNYSNAVEYISETKDDLFKLINKLHNDQTQINEYIIILTTKIELLNKKIAPLKNKINGLYMGEETSEGMLSDITEIYNQQLVGTCLLGILTLGAATKIYRNWKSAK